jgi:hypothetical protein
MRKHATAAALGLMATLLTTTPLYAQNQGENSLRLGLQYSQLMSGQAGKGDNAPDYDDAFSSGLGATLEYQRRMDEQWSLLLGTTYESFDGDDHDGIRFDDMERTTLYGGVRFDFEPSADWLPYARFDIGASRVSGVAVHYSDADGDFSGRYWESSWQLTTAAGVGVEKEMGEWNLFGEVLLRYTDGPDGELGEMADAKGSLSLPIRIGVSRDF